MTLRQRLTHVWEKHGHRDSQLDSEPEIPDAAEHLWLWFWELDSGRQVGMGHSPLSWGDIKAWMELTQTPLSPWEVGLFKQMDQAYLEMAQELSKRK